MKKTYVSPELVLNEAMDVISTSAYVETERVDFPLSSGESPAGMGSANDDLFEI